MTVYQACGFDFVGVMAKGGRSLGRDGERIVAEQALRRQYGTASIPLLRQGGLVVEPCERKGRYFAFRGSHRERRELRAEIAHLIKPYPKRAPSPAPHVSR